MRFAARSMQLVVLASGSVRSRRAQDCSTLHTLPHVQSSRAVQLGMLASRQKASSHPRASAHLQLQPTGQLWWQFSH